MKILIVFANPRGTSALRLGEEDKTIQECIRRAKNRDNLSLTIHHAATVDDIRRALLDADYEIVHFSGHGTGTGLALEDKNGQLFIPPQQALADLLAEFSPPIKCLLLNACYSIGQGQFTSLGVPFTIAMEGPVSDDAAILFAAAFYDSIGAGRDPEFSFRQGIYALRLANHPDSIVPHLLKKGEFTAIENVKDNAEQHAVKAGDRDIAPLLLLGIALDVSGSMEENLRNSMGREQSRLKSFTEAFEQSVARTRQFLNSMEGSGGSGLLFAYAFGMRAGGVCDLFSLLKVASNIISQDEIEQLKQKYTRQIQQRYSNTSGLGGLESLARSYGFGSMVDSVKQGIRADAESEVRRLIMGDIQGRLLNSLRSVGDTTVDLDELAKLWSSNSPDWENAEPIIFGSTPMKEALHRVLSRFHQELAKQAQAKVFPVLVLVSDGESTDGDPVPYAQELKKLGITIISCYITDRDVVAIKTLSGKHDPSWPPGALKMFEMASEIPDDSPLTQYLLRNGWSIARHAKAFIQANHSEVLQDLLGMAMSPVESGKELLPKGK